MLFHTLFYILFILHLRRIWGPALKNLVCTSPFSCSLNTDFIAWRGHLVKILCTPYESRDPWRMDACRYNGTIYISEVETEARKMQRASDNERQKLMCYWGYKFEDYMTKPFSGISSFFQFCNLFFH